MFWSSSCNFTDGEVTVQLVVSVHRSNRDAKAQRTGLIELSWGTYGRLIVTSDAGQLLVDAEEVTVTTPTSDTVTGQEAIAFLKTHEGFPQVFKQSKCVPRPYFGNKYPLE